MKKLQIKVLIVFLAILITSACSSAKKDDNTIEIWAWDPNYNIVILEEAKEIFLKDNPDAKIVIKEMAKAEIEQKLTTMLQSKQTKGLPDLVLIEDYNFPGYIKNYESSFYDVSDVIKKDDFADYKLPALTNSDGKLYGIPFDSGVAGLYYREDLLNAAGIDTKQLENGITSDDFVKMGIDYNKKTGKKFISFNKSDYGTFSQFIHGANSWWTTSKDGKDSLNIKDNDAIKATLDMSKSMWNANIVHESIDWATWVGAINGGEIAVVPQGMWLTGTIKSAEDQKGKWRVAPMPTLSNVNGATPYANSGGCSYAILSHGNTELASKFMSETFAGSVDLYNEILPAVGAVGTWKQASEAKNYEVSDDFFGGEKIYEKAAQWQNKIPSINYGSYTGPVGKAVVDQFNAYIDGKIDYDTLVNNATKQLESEVPDLFK